MLCRMIILHQNLKSNHNQYGFFPEILLDYFTSKFEIKPQPLMFLDKTDTDYFTSKFEIKPQQ